MKCSNCGGTNDPHLVTLLYGDISDLGRCLVYCSSCRKGYGGPLGVSIPESMVTPEVVRELYRLGKTGSPPELVVNHILGMNEPRLVMELEALLSQAECQELNKAKQEGTP